MSATERPQPPRYVCEFASTLWRVPGKGGWVFTTVPEEHAPTVAEGWGRTPVVATVDGRAWETCVWRTKTGRTDLAVPREIRGSKDDGDAVRVRLEYPLSYRR
jgi:hypothetical protein